jgi:D-tagatose-1,6-bisphosphate aldolase subunit GatZ/KbaZ
MNIISLTEMMNATAKLKENGEQFTLMGIGPMSRVCIEAALELAHEKDFPLMLIASRNQVDSDEFGHGYVCNWDQKRFVDDTYAIAKRIGFDGLVYFCRDHGGPWQRDEERKAKLETETAMKLAEKSYLEDIKSGFHLLHIDPTKDPHIIGTVPLETVLSRTVELIEYLENERRKANLPAIAYEVGTEETNGGLTSETAFEDFITKLLNSLQEKGLPKPDFIVGQTGTLTRLTENVGHFNFSSAMRLSKIASELHVGIKEHNSDYLRDAILIDHPHLGVTASNIAPEFGVVETRAYLELAQVESIEYDVLKASKLKKVINEEAVKCERWRKWMVDKETAEMAVEDVLLNEELATVITDICGHYTFETEAVKRELAVMEDNLSKIGIDIYKYAIRKVKDSIDRYAFLFNLYGLSSKLIKL